MDKKGKLSVPTLFTCTDIDTGKKIGSKISRDDEA